MIVLTYMKSSEDFVLYICACITFSPLIGNDFGGFEVSECFGVFKSPRSSKLCLNTRPGRSRCALDAISPPMRSQAVKMAIALPEQCTP